MSLRSELLSKTKESLEALKLPFKVKSEKKSFEQWMIDKETKIAELDYNIQESKSKDELKIDCILDMIDENDLLKRRLEQGEKLMKELFGTEE